jgi:DNA-binding LytR/AlgR family response regulator
MKAEVLFFERKMVIPVRNGASTRYCDGLMYIIYDKPYSELHFKGGDKYLVKISLHHFMENLPEAVFMKCKRSALVNLCHHKGIRKNPPTMVMDDGALIELSKQNLPELQQKLKSLSQSMHPYPDDDLENR